jgi:hypothetical protein
LDLKQAELPSIGWNLQTGASDVAVTATQESSEEGREFYNGHTFEVEDLGAPTIVLDGITYVSICFQHCRVSRCTPFSCCWCRTRKILTLMRFQHLHDGCGEVLGRVG